MSSPYNSKKFKQLQAKWYKKLKDNNFEDIEEIHKGEFKIKKYHSYHFVQRFLRRNGFSLESKQEYYELCLEFLHVYSFESLIERRIWEAHAQGASLQEISDSIKGSERGYRKTHVYNIVRRLIGIMKGAAWNKPLLKKIS